MSDESSHDHHHHDHEHGGSDEDALREQFKRLRVADLAYEMMVGLVTVGYQKLGLTDHTRELRNLDDAHFAIELLRASLAVAEREAGSDEFKDLRATLAQMQLGYAQAVQLAEPATQDEPATKDEPAEAESATDESAADSP